MDLNGDREILRGVGSNPRLLQVGDHLRVKGDDSYVDIKPQDLLALALEPRQPDNAELRQLQDEFFALMLNPETVAARKQGKDVCMSLREIVILERIQELTAPPNPLEQRILIYLENMAGQQSATAQELAAEWKARLSQTP